MGPRIFIRGYAAWRRSPIRPPACFNGAADFHPRIRLLVRRIQSSPRASMGPRIFIRGYVPAEDVQVVRHQRFNGAADFHPRIPPTAALAPATYWLQWGRGFSSADTRGKMIPLLQAIGFNGAADFHPRIHRPQTCGQGAPHSLQWGRGFSSADTAEPRAAGGYGESPSMGPRIFIRGYIRNPSQRRPRSRLQWGRGFSSADTAAGIPRRSARAYLQWGRGFSSADTARSRRREQKLFPSMGPRIFIRGYPNSRMQRSSVLTFNGAADFHPRILGSGRRARGESDAFNGAADFHPRIRWSTSAVVDQPALQWGRGFSSADTAEQQSRDHHADPSMGPRIFIRGYSPPIREPCGPQPAFNGAADFHPRIP